MTEEKEWLNNRECKWLFVFLVILDVWLAYLEISGGH